MAGSVSLVLGFCLFIGQLLVQDKLFSETPQTFEQTVIVQTVTFEIDFEWATIARSNTSCFDDNFFCSQ